VAEVLRADAERRLVLEVAGLRPRVEKVAYSVAAAEFLRSREVEGCAKGTIENYQRSLTRFGLFLKTDLPLSKVSAEHLDGFKAHLHELRYGRKTVRNEVMTIVTLLHWARKRRFIAEDPSTQIDLPRPVRYQPRPLRQDAYLALMKAIDDEGFKDIVDFYILTGIRRADGPTIRWSEHVDMAARTIVLPQAKQKNWRTLYISDELERVLQRLRLRAKGGDRLIPIHKSDLSKRFRAYAEKAGLPKHLTFHSLRHSFASWLVEAGVSLRHVQHLIGHADARSTEIYAGVFDEGLRREIQRLRLPAAEVSN